MRTIHWTECVVCTKPIAKPRIHKYNWRLIYETGYTQLWVCEQDLKESFVQEAQIAFGKALEQVVRIGSHPEILYPVEVVDEN